MEDALEAIGAKVYDLSEFENGAPPGGYFPEISVNENLALAGSFAVNPK